MSISGLCGVKMSTLWLLLAAMTLAACTPGQTAVPPDALIIRSSHIIDGTGAPPFDGVVILHGAHIWDVGPATTFAIPPAATVLDVGAQAVLPGIIDAHVHFTSDAGTRRAFLTTGVTSVCDLATSLRSMPAFAHETTRDGLLAARGWMAGPILAAPGGYPATVTPNHWHYPIRGPAAAETAVADLIAHGATMIKIALEPGPQDSWPLLTAAELDAIVTAAHAHGVPVRAHVHRADLLDLALNAGVDTVEHLPLPFCLETDVPQLVQDRRLTPTAWPELRPQYERMAAQGIILVPTLSAHCCITHDLMTLSPEEQAAIDAFMLALVQQYHELGGTIALGTDYGTPGLARGMPLREMALLQDAGLSPAEVLQSATRHAAQACGQDVQLGTLAAGKLADLIVVDGDPLADLDALDRVTLVVKNGVIAYGRP